MGNTNRSRLRFNFGYMLEAELGTSRTVEFEYPSVQANDVLLKPLDGHFMATRVSEGVFINGELYSHMPAECMRCLETAVLPISIELDEMFYYPPSTAPEGENVIGDDGFIELTGLVRDLAILALPLQPLCRSDCQGMCDQCGFILNIRPCVCVTDDIDPRMAKLRELLRSKQES